MPENKKHPFISKNYHTHTCLCKHASGDVADYCRAAINNGLTVLGMTDHTPFPDNRWSDVRMEMAQLPGYCRSIDMARKTFLELMILKGMECEYVPEYMAYYQDTLLDELAFDYLIGGIHYFFHKDKWHGADKITDSHALPAYAEHVIHAMESGIFAFISHPDLFALSYLEWDIHAENCSRQILEAAQTSGIPLEINCNGFRRKQVRTSEGIRPGYPLEHFWNLAENYDIKVLVNSDAHSPADIVADTDRGLAIAEKHGLTMADMSALEKKRV